MKLKKHEVSRMLKNFLVMIIVILFLSPVAFAAQLLDANEVGFGGKTRNDNYDELVNAMYSNGKVVSSIGSNMWVPWFKTSSGCQQTDLQSGSNCNSGQGIDFQP